MAQITQSEFDAAKLRSSQEDYKRLLYAVEADGVLEVVDDPKGPDPAPLTDEEGNEVTDAEGNTVLQAPEPAVIGAAVEIEIDNEPEAEAEEED